MNTIQKIRRLPGTESKVEEFYRGLNAIRKKKEQDNPPGPYARQGKAFYSIRTELDLTRDEMAKLLHISKAMIQRWEMGHVKPGFHVLLSVLEFLPPEYRCRISMEDYGYKRGTDLDDDQSHG